MRIKDDLKRLSKRRNTQLYKHMNQKLFFMIIDLF